MTDLPDIDIYAHIKIAVTVAGALVILTLLVWASNFGMRGR